MGTAMSEMSAATLFERAQDGDESVLDAAFECIEITSRFYSTSVARAVEEHWLWGTGWKSVAHSMGVARQAAADRCYAAFGWMDRNIAFDDGGARYVGAGK